ncbi:hypothetical protein GGR54DRAFT_247513 [Hypoxylon sp. NC1633]|nr:hypothetical protein GGR54DRAFT_247513 [Hypoxylon sp. NC1633]
MAKIRPKPKYGRRPNTVRQRPSRVSQLPVTTWTGSFRFFDLAPELRDHILRLLILGWDSAQKDCVSLFLTCHRLYAEAAEIFYSDVLLDNMHLKGTPDPFLVAPLTSVAPRPYVRNLTIRFTLKEQIYLFGESYGAALSEMNEKGKLRNLRLEIGNPFPSSEFWGYMEEITSHENVCMVGGRAKGSVHKVPRIVTRTPFQNFLKFLEESNIPKISLFVDAHDHAPFWCVFHAPHPLGLICDGRYRGSTRVLKIPIAMLIESLKGAQAVGPGHRRRVEF